MANWIGINLNDSLNSIKGQISNFTKEVLTDDGVEGSDLDVVISRKKLKKLEDELEISKQENHDLRNRLIQLEENLQGSELSGEHRVTTLKQNLSDTQEKLRLLKEKSVEWEWGNSDCYEVPIGNVSEYVERVTYLEKLLQEERQKHEEEVFKIREQHRQLNARQTNSLQANSTSVSSQVLDEKNHDIENLKQQISSLNSQLERVTEENSQLSTSLEDLDRQHTQAVEQILQTKNNLSAEVSQSKQQIEELKESKTNLEIQISELGAKNEDCSQTNSKNISELQEKYSQLIREHKKIEQDNQKLEQDKQKIEQDNQNLEQNNQKLEQDKQNLEQGNQLLEENKKKVEQHHNQQFAEKNQKWILEIETSDKELETLRKEATQRTKLIGQLKDKLESQHENILKYEAVLEEKNNEHLSAYNRMKLAQEANVTLSAQAEDNGKQIEELNQQMQDNAKILDKLKDVGRVQSNEELETTFSEMWSEVASLRCERDKLEGEVAKAAQELRASQDLADVVDADKSDLEKECEELRDQLEELQRGERPPPEGLSTIEEEEDGRMEEEEEEVVEEEKREKSKKEESSSNDERFQREISALAEARQNLELELSTVKKEKLELSQQLKDLTSQVGNVQNLEKEAASLRSTNQSLSTELSETREELGSLSLVNVSNAKFKDQVQHLTETLERVTRTNESMHEDDMKHLAAQLDAKSEQLSRKDKQIHEYFHEIARLREDNSAQSIMDDMTAELDKLKGLQVYKDDQIDELRAGIQQIGELFNAPENNTRSVFVTAKQWVDGNKHELEENKRMIKQSSEQEANNSKEVEELRAELEENKRMIKQSSDQEANNSKEVEELRAELEGNKRLIKQSSEQEANNSKEVEELRAELEETNEKLRELKEFMRKRINDAEMQKKQYSDIQELLKTAQLELQKKDLEQKAIKADFDLGYRNQYAASRRELNAKQQIIDRLETEIQTKADQFDELSTNLESLSIDIEQKECKVKDTLKSFEEMSLIITEGKTKMNSMQLEISSLKSMKEALEKTKKENENEIDSLRADFTSRLEEIKNSSGKSEDKLRLEIEAKVEELKTELEAAKRSAVEKEKQFEEVHRQNSDLIGEKEKLIVMSTQKHQESLSYYSEIQRLTQVILKTNEDHTKTLESISQEVNLKTEALKKLQEENSSLTKKLSRVGDEDSSAKNQMRLLQEELRRSNNEMAKQQELFRSVESERDQLRKANATFNAQYEEKSKLLIDLQEKETHSSVEIARLREHLMEMEATTTDELLQKEKKEVTLKTTIAQLHERMASHSQLYSNTKEKSSAQIEEAETRLRSLIADRDDLNERLQVSEEKGLEQQEGLTNLQQVLHDFQKSQSKDIVQATERERRKCQEEKDKNSKLEAELKKLQERLDALQSSMSTVQSLNEDLTAREDTIVALRSQVHSTQLAAKKSQEQVATLRSFTDSKVDKPLIRNLLVGYFATPSDKRNEVLRVLAQVLDFSSEERSRTGIDAQGTSWMSSIANFLAPPPSNVRVASKVDVLSKVETLDHSSLSQAFIRFLEDESTPRQHPQLPAVQMAQDAHKKAEKKATMNSSPLLMPPAVESSTVQPVAPKETNSLLEQPKFLSNLLNPTDQNPENSEDKENPEKS